MRIKKVSQSSGLIANVSNTQSNSQTDAYSCDYIEDNFDKKEVYSTDEIDTGKIWIDGKHIYRKVFTKTSGISTGSGNVGALGNISTLITLRGILKAGATSSPMPSANTSDLGWQTNLYMANNGGGITYEIGGNYSPTSMLVIAEYTKLS